MFVDKVTIEINAGNGGNGKVSFRHTINQRKGGGPDGGDGGRGGNIVLRADHNTNSLSQYRSAKAWRSEEGVAGGPNRRHGRNGNDLILTVPPGTTVSEEETQTADLDQNAAEFIAARGGDGGFGNAHFTTSTRQAPRFAELGEEGERKKLTLELKMTAEVGLIGLPNAGKSTLLSVISNAKPEIANYAFTTLVPNLGMVGIDDRNILFADIPGLIEGASKGRGLGDEFLRHVERTRVLVHLIDTASTTIVRDWRTITTELKRYNPILATKAQLVVLSKIDTISEVELKRQIAKLERAGLRAGKNLFTMSAQAHRGLDIILRAVVAELQKPDAAMSPTSDLPVIGMREADVARAWSLEVVENGFRVHGTAFEKLAARTNFDQSEAVARLKRILIARGVGRELARAGVQAGTTIWIGKKRIQW